MIQEQFDTPVDLDIDGGSFSLKSPTAYRTIGEVSTELGVPQHVLRFWEEKFPAIRPVKRGGGRRYYRLQDVESIKKIKHLLYDKGFTIKGAQQLLKQNTTLFEDSHEPIPQITAANSEYTSDFKANLYSLIEELKQIQKSL